MDGPPGPPCPCAWPKGDAGGSCESNGFGPPAGAINLALYPARQGRESRKRDCV
jgi:hypothetical protein